MSLIFKIIKETPLYTKCGLAYKNSKLSSELQILNIDLIDFLTHIKPDIFLCESGKKIYFFDIAKRYKKYDEK